MSMQMSSANLAHLIDPLVDPKYQEQDIRFEKIFDPHHDQVSRNHLSGYKRTEVDALDWAGDKLLIASHDHTVRLFDVERNEKERSWSGDWMAMQCNPVDPHIAAAVAWNGKFRVFDTRSSSTVIHDTSLPKEFPNLKEFLCLAWSPDAKYVALSNRSDQVYTLDLRHGKNRLSMGGSAALQHEVNALTWSADGEHIWMACGSQPGRIQVHPAALPEEGVASLVAHNNASLSLATDPKGNHIASGGGDCLVTLWDPNLRVCTKTFGYATQAVTTLGFNHTGSLLAWGTGDKCGGSSGEKNLTIVGANTDKLYMQEPTAASVTCVKWHAKRNVLAYALSLDQLPDERDRRLSARECSVVHTLKIPES